MYGSADCQRSKWAREIVNVLCLFEMFNEIEPLGVNCKKGKRKY